MFDTPGKCHVGYPTLQIVHYVHTRAVVVDVLHAMQLRCHAGRHAGTRWSCYTHVTGQCIHAHSKICPCVHFNILVCMQVLHLPITLVYTCDTNPLHLYTHVILTRVYACIYIYIYMCRYGDVYIIHVYIYIYIYIIIIICI